MTGIKDGAVRRVYKTPMEAEHTAALLAKYGAAVPRYTSYPTAPHFCAQPASADVAALLRGRDRNAALSLYFHIPFCRHLCHYCGCFTKVTSKDGPIRDYIALLDREVALIGALLGEDRPRVTHIHCGGGSPNSAAPAQLAGLLDTVRRFFTVADDAELALEIDPRLMTHAKAQGYAAAGFTRASLGVQDVHPDTQRAIGRVQPFEDVAACTADLRAAGFSGINFDLMFGLPHQTPDRLAATADSAADLAPDRIALFGYAHVPWMRPHQKLLDDTLLPGSAERFAQQESARARLIARGYRAIGMDHFARPDDPLCAPGLRRNFQGYTSDAAPILLGFGLSAIGAFPDAYLQNTTDIETYRAALERGEPPVARGCYLTPEDRLRRAVIESLMCAFSADTAALCAAHGLPLTLLAESIGRLAPYREDGLLTLDGPRIVVTETGRPFVRGICACFDAYLDPTLAAPRHAQAV